IAHPRRADAGHRKDLYNRILDPASVRPFRGRRASRQARPPRPRAQIDTRDRGGIPARARMVRGAVVVKEVSFAVPGDLGIPTGGYTYDRRIIAELPALGWRTQVGHPGEGFPYPSAETAAAACGA